jgi:hypothetical protein
MHFFLLHRNFEAVATRLMSLEKKSKIKQFLQGKKEIQGIKASITSCIQDFTVRFLLFAFVMSV